MVVDDFFDVGEPADFYAQIILTVLDRAPLLADDQRARLTMAVLDACAPDAPGRLWGYVVLPDSVRLVVGPTDENALEAYVETVKARTEDRLLDAIRRANDDSLDVVLRYSPVWGGAIYHVWQAGSHRAVFLTEYKLSNALYELQQAPVAAGLVESAGAWPYTWVGGAETGTISPLH